MIHVYALDNKCFTTLIMIDMSAAFDTTDHNISLHRLSHQSNTNKSVLSWFRSYLNNRSHCVDVSNDIQYLTQFSCILVYLKA